jgi:hypothetical protein
LAEYNYILHHRKGALNRKADLLSRRAGHSGVENDNENDIVLKESHFRNLDFTVESPGEEIVKKIKDCSKIDSSILNALKKELPGSSKQDGIIYYKEKIYVPHDDELREEIIHLSHDVPMAGHPGEYCTQEIIERNYWWPRMGNQIKEFVRTCEPCQKSKVK